MFQLLFCGCNYCRAMDPDPAVFLNADPDTDLDPVLPNARCDIKFGEIKLTYE